MPRGLEQMIFSPQKALLEFYRKEGDRLSHTFAEEKGTWDQYMVLRSEGWRICFEMLFPLYYHRILRDRQSMTMRFV